MIVIRLMTQPHFVTRAFISARAVNLGHTIDICVSPWLLTIIITSLPVNLGHTIDMSKLRFVLAIEKYDHKSPC